MLTAPPVARYRREFDQYLRSFLSAQDPRLLYGMVRYHLGWEDVAGLPLAAEGKGLRPSLCLLTCDALSGDCQRALPAAAAIELVHNFSLVHDDIQDRDAERHHRPTVWSVWGEAQAINAGDALFALAHLALWRLADGGVTASTVLATAGALDARTLEMVEGQTLDLEFEQRLDVEMPEYLQMIEKKTGALFDCSLHLGALVAGGDDSLSRQLGTVGRSLGTAFQIRDDMLGIWGDESKTGKPAEDIRRRKKSLPVVYAINEGSATVRDKLKVAYERTALTEEDIATVLSGLESAGARDYCAQVAESYRDRALEALDTLPLSAERKRDLRETAVFLLERDF